MPTTTVPDNVITRRRLQVLAEVANGLSNAQIAKKLYLTEDTVKTHLRKITGALGVRGLGSVRAAAVAVAIRRGLLRFDSDDRVHPNYSHPEVMAG